MSDQLIKKQLQSEFLALASGDKLSLSNFNSVVILSAEEVEVEGENKARIDTGLELVHKINQPQVVFLGTKMHNDCFLNYTSPYKGKIIILCPTDDLEENTMTQIKILSDLRDKNLDPYLIVSNAYHVPRIKRYCAKYIGGQKYDFFPVGKISDQELQAEEEFDKIINYARKGDLPLFV